MTDWMQWWHANDRLLQVAVWLLVSLRFTKLGKLNRWTRAHVRSTVRSVTYQSPRSFWSATSQNSQALGRILDQYTYRSETEPVLKSISPLDEWSLKYLEYGMDGETKLPLNKHWCYQRQRFYSPSVRNPCVIRCLDPTDWYAYGFRFVFLFFSIFRFITISVLIMMSAISKRCLILL